MVLVVVPHHRWECRLFGVGHTDDWFARLGELVFATACDGKGDVHGGVLEGRERSGSHGWGSWGATRAPLLRRTFRLFA